MHCLAIYTALRFQCRLVCRIVQRGKPVEETDPMGQSIGATTPVDPWDVQGRIKTHFGLMLQQLRRVD